MAYAGNPSADGPWVQEEAARVASLARIRQLRHAEPDPMNDQLLREEYSRLLEQSTLLIWAAVRRVLSRFATSPLSAEDLFDEGAARILKTAHHYYPERGWKASIYLFYIVKTQCQRRVYECLSVVKVPMGKVERARSAFRKSLGRAARDLQELVEAGLLTEKQVRDVCRGQQTRTGSFGTGGGHGEGASTDPLAALADSRHAGPSLVAERVDEVGKVVRAVDAIAARNPQAGEVLRARLGIAADGTLTGMTRTFEEIGAAQGVTKQWVEQIYKKAHCRLLELLGEGPADHTSEPDCRRQ